MQDPAGEAVNGCSRDKGRRPLRRQFGKIKGVLLRNHHVSLQFRFFTHTGSSFSLGLAHSQMSNCRPPQLLSR
jgi:hypothetical protein